MSIMTDNAVPYPGDQPYADPNYTVDEFVNDPTRVTNYLSDLSLRQYVHDKIFSYAGSVSGGGVVYEQLTTNDLFLTRDVQNVAPGAEFPIVNDASGKPLFAPVEKFGGKWWITDEARDRNDISKIQTEGRKAMNNMYRKMDEKAIALLERTIEAFPSQVIAGSNWDTVVIGGSNPTPVNQLPFADFAKVIMMAENNELGVDIDTWIVNPAQKAQLSMVYGVGNVDALAREYGVNVLSSRRIQPGTAYALEAGQVGQIRDEKPLSTETWREPETQRTWFQVDRRPVMFVTNPYSIFKVQGLAG